MMDPYGGSDTDAACPAPTCSRRFELDGVRYTLDEMIAANGDEIGEELRSLTVGESTVFGMCDVVVRVA